MKKYYGIALLIAFTACNNATNKTKEANDSTSVKISKPKVVAPQFKDTKVAAIYLNYIVLKDALVNTKFTDAKTASLQLAEALKNYAGCENTSFTVQKIAKAKDIATQRKEFTALSTDVIALFKHAELTKGKIFIQHCPMANNGEGGDWLSSEKKIQNPYYGDEMMECGAVLEEIKSKI